MWMMHYVETSGQRSRAVAYLSYQIAAWKKSWQRVAGGDKETRRHFLERVGAALGEHETEAAVRRGMMVLGLDTGDPESERR